MIKGPLHHLSLPTRLMSLCHFADLVKVFMRKVHVPLLEGFWRKVRNRWIIKKIKIAPTKVGVPI